MRPYYDDGQIQIWCGDCRDIIDRVVFDVLITDPPYGVDLGIGNDRRGASPGKGKHGLGKRSYIGYEDSYDNYIHAVIPTVNACVERAKRAAIFAGPHAWDLPRPDAFGGIYCPNGSGRHRWGFNVFLPVLFYGTAPNLHRGAHPNVMRFPTQPQVSDHPCPKPLEWMRWLVALATSDADIVLDPFMGSGTTLRAAKDLGRRAIGIEIEERYCEIAVKRLAQQVLPLAMVAD